MAHSRSGALAARPFRGGSSEQHLNRRRSDRTWLWRLGHQLPPSAQHGQGLAPRYLSLARHGLPARQDPLLVAIQTSFGDRGRAQYLSQPAAAQEAPGDRWCLTVCLRDLRHFRMARPRAGLAVGPPQWRRGRSPPRESTPAVPELPLADRNLPWEERAPTTPTGVQSRAEGGTRTPTRLPSPHFECGAAADYAT